MVHILHKGASTVHLHDDHVKADVCMLMHMGVRYHTMILFVIRYRMVLHPFMANIETFLLRLFKVKEFSNMTQELIPARQATKQNIPIHFKAFVATNTTTSILVYPTLACHSSCERPCSHHNTLLQQTKDAEI